MSNVELATPQIDGSVRVDKPVEIRFSVGSDSIIAFFNTCVRVAGTDFGERFDAINTVSLPAVEIKSELQSIFEKLLALRSRQIVGESIAIQYPDYKAFLSELLSLAIFRVAQEQAKSNQVLNVAYTDFSVMLSNAISGVEIVPALQASLDAILENLILADNEREECLGPLRDAIAHCNIPLSIKNPEVA